MNEAFRTSIIGVCAIAWSAMGQPALAADAHAVPIVRSVPFVSGAKLAIVSGNNQQQPIHPDPNFSNESYRTTFSVLAVKLTTASGVLLANAPIVFTCHAPTDWVCQVNPSGGSMSITTDGNGIATLSQGGIGPITYYGGRNPEITCPRSGCLVTVTATYGIITSTTFNLQFQFPPVGGLGGTSSG